MQLVVIQKNQLPAVIISHKMQVKKNNLSRICLKAAEYRHLGSSQAMKLAWAWFKGDKKEIKRRVQTQNQTLLF